jgi:hypothetical protein
MISPNRILKGIKNPNQAASHIVTKTKQALLQYQYDDSGTLILEEDWDTLVILDCARHDSFRKVNSIDGKLQRKRSVASATPTFIQLNFRDQTAHDTLYLSANPKAGKHRECMDIFKLVGMWSPNPVREKRGGTNTKALMDPKPVVDRSIELHEEYPNKRHIVHLMPPHVPHMWKDGERLDADSAYQTYEAARRGEISAEEMREVYEENLEYVLDCLDPLLDAVSGKIVISGDHGELLGEGVPWWVASLHGRRDNHQQFDFGHYDRMNADELRDVPWLEIDTGSRREIESSHPEPADIDIDSIDEQLEALGYR